HARRRHDTAGGAGDSDADRLGADIAARRFNAADAAALDAEAGDLAVLDQVDAAHVGAAGIAPDDGVMARRTAARLHQAALDGKARIVEVEEGKHGAQLFPPEQPRIGAGQDHGVAAPPEGIALRVGMKEIDDAALRYHRVEV